MIGDRSYQYLTTDDMKMLADDSISPIKVKWHFTCMAPTGSHTLQNRQTIILWVLILIDDCRTLPLLQGVFYCSMLSWMCYTCLDLSTLCMQLCWMRHVYMAICAGLDIGRVLDAFSLHVNWQAGVGFALGNLASWCIKLAC